MTRSLLPVSARPLGAAFTMYPILVAHANDHAPESGAIAIGGGVLPVFGIGSMVGPSIGGELMRRVGPQGLFPTTLVAHLPPFGHTRVRISRRAAVTA